MEHKNGIGYEEDAGNMDQEKVAAEGVLDFTTDDGAITIRKKRMPTASGGKLWIWAEWRGIVFETGVLTIELGSIRGEL